MAEQSAPIEFESPPAYQPDLAAVDGKTVYFIANALTEPYWQNILDSMEEAAALVGIELVAVDGKGSPAEVARLVDQAISQDVLAIIMGAIPSDIASGPIRKAVDAGIHVIATDNMGLSESDQKAGVFANVAPCFECAGREMADIAVSELGTDINALIIRVPETGPSEAASASGFTEELQRLCPDCTVTEREAPLAQWATALPSIGSSIASDPEINLVVPVFDAMIPMLRPPLAAASREISIVSNNATLAAMELLAADDLVIGLTGAPGTWTGWYVIDQVLRAVSGAEPLEGPISGNRSFTRDNIDEIDLSKPDATWYSDIDLAEAYSDYWGI